MLWDGTAEQIEPHADIPCQQCEGRPAVLLDQAGEYWCQECLDEARAGLFRLVNDLVKMEQRRQQPEPPLTPAEVERWWQRGLLSPAEALRYCVAGIRRAREEAEVTGLSWCMLSEDIQTTEATWTQYEL
jgi:hypothetical protein